MLHQNTCTCFFNKNVVSYERPLSWRKVMYPYDIIPGFDLYALFYTLALISALLWLRILGDRLGLEPKLYNFTIVTGILAIIVGYICSIMTQTVYDYIETGVFRFGTGMTFYGGLLGGTLSCVLIYFTVGAHLFRDDRLHLRRVPMLEGIAACCVSFAHATGRIGCLFAGCCHGARTDAWYGVYNVGLGYKTVPTQLLESVFLYIIFAVIAVRLLRGKPWGHIIYLIAYGVWRFGIEFLRADDRGASFIPGLTPSQTSAIFFIAAGVVIYIIERNLRGRHGTEVGNEA